MRNPSGYMHVFVEGDVIALYDNPAGEFPTDSTDIQKFRKSPSGYVRISDLHTDDPYKQDRVHWGVAGEVVKLSDNEKQAVRAKARTFPKGSTYIANLARCDFDAQSAKIKSYTDILRKKYPKPNAERLAEIESCEKRFDAAFLKQSFLTRLLSHCYTHAVFLCPHEHEPGMQGKSVDGIGIYLYGKHIDDMRVVKEELHHSIDAQILFGPELFSYEVSFFGDSAMSENFTDQLYWRSSVDRDARTIPSNPTAQRLIALYEKLHPSKRNKFYRLDPQDKTRYHEALVDFIDMRDALEEHPEWFPGQNLQTVLGLAFPALSLVFFDREYSMHADPEYARGMTLVWDAKGAVRYVLEPKALTEVVPFMRLVDYRLGAIEMFFPPEHFSEKDKTDPYYERYMLARFLTGDEYANDPRRIAFGKAISHALQNLDKGEDRGR